MTFQTDFSGRVVNNDHFLYWGECARITDDGFEFLFQVVEQTEFIDDASFMPFKGNGMPSQARWQNQKQILVHPKLEMCIWVLMFLLGSFMYCGILTYRDESLPGSYAFLCVLILCLIPT